MAFRIFSDNDLRQAITMRQAVHAMEDAFVSIHTKKIMAPLRTVIATEKQNGQALFMPSYSADWGLFGLKMVSVFPENGAKGLLSIQGKVLVMDADTGEPLMLTDASYLTALRTGAASGLATSLLANPSSRVLAVFGTGGQAMLQAEGVLSVLSVEKILVKGTSLQKENEWCSEVEKKFNIPTVPITNPNQLAEADVICTATSSMKPVFAHRHLKPGVHINAIGSFKKTMQEVPGETVKEALLIVDQVEAALEEAGDVAIPLQEGLIDAGHIHAELGEIILMKKPGRTRPDQITLFKSVGHAAQDLAIAKLMLGK